MTKVVFFVFLWLITNAGNVCNERKWYCIPGTMNVMTAVTTKWQMMR